MMVMAVSSLVTLLTAGTFLFLTRNMNGPDHEQQAVSRFNARISREIFRELEALSACGVPEEGSNEADYELLEEKFKFLMEEEQRAEQKENEVKVEEQAEEVKVKERRVWGGEEVVESGGDLVIEATHALVDRPGGQHRPYRLSLHFSPRSNAVSAKRIPWNQCKVLLEWPLPRSVFVDVWALRRLAPFTVEMGKSSHQSTSASTVSVMNPIWSVKPRHPDLEVGVYDPRAKPFLLTAEISLREVGESPLIVDGVLLDSGTPWNLDIKVPDVMVRYQRAKLSTGLWFKDDLLLRSDPIYLPTPSLHFQCSGNSEEIQVDWRTDRLRPLQLDLPVAPANSKVFFVTFGTFSACLVALMFSLLKY